MKSHASFSATLSLFENQARPTQMNLQWQPGSHKRMLEELMMRWFAHSWLLVAGWAQLMSPAKLRAHPNAANQMQEKQ